MNQSNVINNKINIPSYYHKKWMALDNAAKIYPAAKSKKWPAMFRLSTQLSEDVDINILSVALEHTLKRLPGFSQRLRRGFFWYFLEHQESSPPIWNDVNNPCAYLDIKANNNFLFCVRCYGKRISVEFFHALADGTGGMCFLKTLTAEYLTLKYGVTVTYSDDILNCRDKPDDDELEDSFLKYARPVKKSRHEQKAYHINSKREELGTINIITGLMPLNEISTKAKQYSATINEFLTSMLIMAIYNVQQKNAGFISKRRPVKICVPVNLRKFYPSKTLRNFSSYINVGIDPRLGVYTFEEIIKIVKHTMALEASEKELNAKLSTNVSSEKNAAIRALPLFLKNPVMKLVYLAVGDRYNSATLSNLGLVKLPDEMSKYVERFDFLLGMSQNPVACSCVSYGNTLSFNFSRTLVEPIVEREFFTSLVKMGIHVKIESNQR